MRSSLAGCLRLLVLSAVLVVGTALPCTPVTSQKCGYDSCPKAKAGVINVHLVPHSHDDVGWLKTVDQYYYGSNTRMQRAGVQYIIDSVIAELELNPERKFIQVETAFFTKWWVEQNDIVREKVKTLVNNGQLEFVGGAWSMNDEATVNYQSTIDQFAWGYRFLNDTFGVCGQPRVAWQIDPFGHSRGFATLLTQMGLDAVFFARIDFQDRDARSKARTQEMVWKTSPNLGGKADLFTGVLYRHYGPPPGFCFDEKCDDDPIIDNPDSPDYNVKRRVDEFANFVKGQANVYTNNVMLTMGDDFHFQSAGKWYKNLDRLIKAVNANPQVGLNAFYSTPSCYLKALHETNKTWTTKEDDFFPYGSSGHSYWTGYFTSRPTHKFMERQGNNFLQVSKQLHSLARLSVEDQAALVPLKEAMGIVQHHDAITGTEKEHVASDYARILTQATRVANDAAAQKSLRKLTQKSKAADPAPPPEFQSCFSLNVSLCETSENRRRFVVTVYNPQAHKENAYVRFPVQAGKFSVLDPQGRQQKYDLVPVPQSVLGIAGRNSKSQYELVFYAEQLPPLGFRSYFIERTGDKLDKPVNYVASDTLKAQVGFPKGATAEISYQNGLLIKLKANNSTMDVKQNFYYYTSAVGEDSDQFDKRSSGAYVFRPRGDEQSVDKKPTFKLFRGELVQEVHQFNSEWVSQVVRTYANEKYVEFVWQVGPIPIDDSKGKEVISRFETPLKTDGLFYTDANGREMLQRKRDFRPTWTVDLKEKASGNYYPITSRLTLRDPQKKQSAAVFVDRAEGGSSLKDGQLELMVHRRILRDDGFGVGEALNETAFGTGLTARGSHVLLVGQDAAGSPTLAAQERILSRRLLLKPWLFFSNSDQASFKEWQGRYVMEYSGLDQALPDNVHLLTLEPWKGNTLLVRLEHIMENNEDPSLSQPATVDLQAILKPFKVVAARETNLAGNMWVGDYTRLSWNTQSKGAPRAGAGADKKPKDSFSVTLNPQDIRTFVVTIN